MIGHSNWMRFVRPARTSTEQNLELNQDGDCLYYITSRSIQPKEELRIWYSKAYADCFGLNHLPASQSESKYLENLSLSSIVLKDELLI